MQKSKRSLGAVAFFLFGAILASAFFLWRDPQVMQGKSKWQGRIEQNFSDSTPDWSNLTPQTPPSNAPNILLISFEDIGFGDLGSYGGMLDTPNLDAIAFDGLRYTNFHIPELWAPAQASLLTGRNHHKIGFSAFSATPTGFPNSTGVIPKSAATIARVLQKNGYATAMFGQWDLSAYYARNPGGPFDTWPTGMGFDRFYGFMDRPLGMQTTGLYRDNQLRRLVFDSSEVTANTRALSALNNFLSEHHQMTSGRPFFGYLSLRSPYNKFPKPEDLGEKYYGLFNAGPIQDSENILLKQKVLKIVPKNTRLPLSKRDDEMHAELDVYHFPSYAQEREEATAKFKQIDDALGGMMDLLEKLGMKENTIIALVSRSNAPQESFSMKVGNTPYVGNYSSHAPLILHWPAGIIDRGGLRHQYHHIIDLAPTLLELTGLEWPSSIDGVKQDEVDGVSMAYTFNSPEALSRRKVQHYESLGKRSIYAEGWLAMKDAPPRSEWELYYLPSDLTAMKDLAGLYPERLRDLKNHWERQAKKYEVYPIDTRAQKERVSDPKPLAHLGRDTYFFYPARAAIPHHALPNLNESEYIFKIDFAWEKDQLGGVLMSFGDTESGWSLILERGKLGFFHSYHNKQVSRTSQKTLKAGSHEVKLHYIARPGPQRVADIYLYLDDKQIAEVRGAQYEEAGSRSSKYLTVGHLLGPTAPEQYQGPSSFEGEIRLVTLQMMRDTAAQSFSE